MKISKEMVLKALGEIKPDMSFNTMEMDGEFIKTNLSENVILNKQGFKLYVSDEQVKLEVMRNQQITDDWFNILTELRQIAKTIQKLIDLS